jgi:hypothetical protein
MKFVALIGLSTVLAASAFAQSAPTHQDAQAPHPGVHATDKYELFPVQTSVDNTSHIILVVNTVTGELFACGALLKTIAPKGVVNLVCHKGYISEGTSPPGSAVVTVNPPTGSTLPAVWRINQTSGDLSICASEETLISVWYCKSIKVQ